MPPHEHRYPHLNFTPEPHFIPGYTGYLPGFGPHKLYQFGKTYGHMTHDIMERHPVAGHRLNRIPSNRLSSDHNRRQRTRGSDNSGMHKYVPPKDLLPRDVVFSRRLCDRPQHRRIPCYANFFTNPANYGQSVYDMSDLDPRKTYMPGYTGYYTGKCNDYGVTQSHGAHQDLCDLTSSRLERLVAEKRPKVADWYRCPVLYPPVAPELTGYHPQGGHRCGPTPGYTGHVPGYRDCCRAEPFGKVAGSLLRQG